MAFGDNSIDRKNKVGEGDKAEGITEGPKPDVDVKDKVTNPRNSGSAECSKENPFVDVDNDVRGRIRRQRRLCLSFVLVRRIMVDGFVFEMKSSDVAFVLFVFN